MAHHHAAPLRASFLLDIRYLPRGAWAASGVWKVPKQRAVPRGLVWPGMTVPRVCAGKESTGQKPHVLGQIQEVGGQPLGLCCVSELFLVKLKAGGLCSWHVSPQLVCAL